ncbi:MAG TPA: FMN-binding glutamate synthase family protein [Firmicutes bacterium]|nr:FMN-binding glutamate synthase family protein [Bacillota bacterium]
MDEAKRDGGKGAGRTDANLWWAGAIGGLAGVAGAGLAGLLSWRLLVRHAFGSLLRRLLTDPYEQNLQELFSATRRMGLQTVLETSLRAEEGKPVKRPFGSPRRLPHFDSLLFDFAQLARFPTEPGQPVDLQTVIGPRAARPLVLDLPLLIAPMAYGFALSEPVKVALAKGAAAAGTATNTGEGPLLPAERQAASKLILQYGRGSWAKDPDTLRQADAIEIQVGLGARGGTGHILPAAQIDEELRRHLGLAPGQDAVGPARLPGVAALSDLRALVAQVRQAGGGVPVGFKIAAGKNLEQDLELALAADPDFLDLSGAQAGSWGAVPALEDDFGVPTLYALARAIRFFNRQGLKGKVSLIVGGGLTNPGEFLKALALGADAVNLGTVALFALAHTQILAALPWEPPTQLMGHRGTLKGRFNPDQGAQSLTKFLLSCRAEMEEGIRALGKTSHRELSPDDLMALDPLTAEICGVAPAYQPPQPADGPEGSAD